MSATIAPSADGLTLDLKVGGVTRATLSSTGGLTVPAAAAAGDAVNRSFGDSRYAALAGSASQTFSASTLSTTTTIGVGATTPAASGAGITFPATQSASSNANTLDDYAEGTFTAGAYCGTSGTITLSNTTGTYTKIGNTIFFSGFFDASSVSSPSGSLTITTNIPYSAANNSRNISAVNIRVNNFVGTAGIVFQAFVNKNTNDIEITAYTQSIGQELSSPAALFQAGTFVVIGGHFMVD